MENLNTGLLFTGMGMLIVFSVLLILMVVIYLMQLLKKDNSANESTVPAPASAPTQTITAIDKNETIAVISATIAAMSGNDPSKRFRVKSIKDQKGNVLWSK